MFMCYTLVAILVISNEWGNDKIVIVTNGPESHNLHFYIKK